MDAARVICQENSESEEKIVNYEKIEAPVFIETEPLTYFYTVTDKWGSGEIPLEKERVRLGKNPYECDVKLSHPDADDVHIVLQRTGSIWHIVESGKNELMKINGRSARQGILKQGAVLVLQVGNDTIIFSTDSSKPQLDEEQADNEAGLLGEGEYALLHERSSLHFPYNHLSLIGSDPLCELSIPGEKFAAMIFNIGRKMYIANLSRSRNSIVDSDGIHVEDGSPLAPGSSIKIGDSDITFKLSKDMRFVKSGLEESENVDSDRMRLVALDQYGNPFEHYDLMKEGSSFTIGRDSRQANIAIQGSSNISRVHCQVIMYKKRMMVMDNSSTNGSFVNGEKIKRGMVKPGDLLQLGDWSFILCFCS
jgi:hypothetical protein